MIRPTIKLERSGGLSKLSGRVTLALKKATFEFGKDVLAEADGHLSGPGPLVPVDIGTLRASGYSADPQITGNRVIGEVGYGGPSAGYAAAVHERVEEGINWSRPGSGPKFLENAINHQAPLFPKRIVYELHNMISSVQA